MAEINRIKNESNDNTQLNKKAIIFKLFNEVPIIRDF